MMLSSGQSNERSSRPKSTPGLDLVVIGHSPRPDVERLFAPYLGNRMLRLFGALDGLAYDEICARSPKGAQDALVTFLRRDAGAPDGPVAVDKGLVETRACHIFRTLSDAGNLRIMFCTGEFPEIARFGDVVMPSGLVAMRVEELVPHGKLGVIAPLPHLATKAIATWSRATRSVAALPLAIDADSGDRRRVLEAMARQKPDAALLDCMTYDRELTEEAQAILDAPTISPILLLQDTVSKWRGENEAIPA